jgi:hypothetical protein
MTEVEGENKQLKEMKVIFEYWLYDSAKYVCETNCDDSHSPPLNLEKLSTKTFEHWMAGQKTPNDLWWGKSYYAKRRSSLFKVTNSRKRSQI